jgi:hypothetical protein
MRRWEQRERGSYILEVAGVIVGIAVFMVGVSDVVRMFQARGAVRAAVNDGLRCLYPTDAGCVESARNSLSPPTKRYNVWVWGSGYRIPQEAYVASARWHTEPVYEVPVDSGELASLDLEQDPFQYATREVLYPTTAHIAYMAQISQLPHVHGGTPLEPYFVDPITRERATPQRTLSLSRVRGVTSEGTAYWETGGFNERFKLGSVSFSMKEAWPLATQDRAKISMLAGRGATSLPCFSGPLRRSLAGVSIDVGAGSLARCAYRGDSSGIWNNSALSVPLMFRVSGKTQGTNRVGEGRVLLSMSWQSAAGSGTVPLGGRVIKSGGSGNFIPRGLSKEDIRDNLEYQYKDYGEELALYGRLPLIPQDATVTISIFLLSVNKKPVAWAGDSIEIFHPRYAFNHERYRCGYSADPRRCASPPVGPIAFIEVPTDSVPQVVQAGGALCSLARRTEAETNPHEVLDQVVQKIRKGMALDPIRFVEQVALDKRECSPQRKRWSCVRNEPIRYLRGCESASGFPLAMERCGVPPEEASRSRIAGLETLRKESTEFHTFKGCSGEKIPECAKGSARKVADHIWDPSQDTSSVCDTSALQSAPTITIGPLNGSLCDDQAMRVRDLYRREEKIPLGVPIVLTRVPAPARFSATPLAGSCTPFDTVDGSNERLLCGRAVGALTAERCCSAANGLCSREEVYTDVTANNGKTRAILDAATQRVVEGIQAGYPAAHYADACGGDTTNCATVVAELSPDSTTAKVSARLTIPLRLLRLGTGSETTVGHSAERMLEGRSFQR